MESINALGFYHEHGMVPAWKLASDFSGKNGRIATIPDIMDARINHDHENFVWNTYFTTLSAEYVGIGRNGNLILIVAHGVGPMSTLNGIQKAYSYSYNDTDRRKKGGRITQEEFLNLEAGKYGKVEVVNLENYLHSREYPFMAAIPESKEELDPVVRARLGNRYVEYIMRCRLNSAIWRNDPSESKDNRQNLQTLTMRDGDVYYFHSRPEKGLAFAHLLSLGCISNMHHDGGISLIHDISCHDWTDGTRLVGIREPGQIIDIHPGFNYRQAVRNPKSREALVIEAEERPLARMSIIEEVADGIWFTQTEKIGARMNTGILEYLVRSFEPVGEQTTFRTTIGGSRGFVKYDLSEVKAVAPKGANAYRFIGASIIWEGGNPEYHDVLVQFYRIEVDTSQRIMREDEVNKDARLLESLISLYG